MGHGVPRCENALQSLDEHLASDLLYRGHRLGLAEYGDEFAERQIVKWPQAKKSKLGPLPLIILGSANHLELIAGKAFPPIQAMCLLQSGLEDLPDRNLDPEDEPIGFNIVTFEW